MHKVKEGVQATDGVYEKVKIWNGSSYQTVYRPMYFQPPPGATIIYGECTNPKKEKLWFGGWLMNKPYLAEDVKCITIETDEKNPITIAVVGDVLSPKDGYRIRVSFED